MAIAMAKPSSLSLSLFLRSLFLPKPTKPEMDLSDIAKKLDLSDSKQVVRRAAELRRLCDIQFDSSVIGVVSFFVSF